MKKRITSLLVVLSLLVPGGMAFATELSEWQKPEEIILQYEDFANVKPKLSVSGSSASYSLVVSGEAGVTSISATLIIQKKNSNGTYSNYGKSWTASSASGYLSTSGKKTVASGGTYRLRVSVTPYFGSTAGQTEIVYS